MAATSASTSRPVSHTLLSQPSASDDPDITHFLSTAHGYALDIATFDALEDALQIFITSHFKHCISQGCTPQEVAVFLPKHDELRHIAEKLATTRIREHAFGTIVASLGILIRDTSSSTSAAPGSALHASTFSTLISLLSAEAKHKPDPTGIVYDHVPLFEYIESQKKHGQLCDDPAWEYDTSLNKNRQWSRAVMKTISQATEAFVEASKKIDWRKQVKADGDVALLTNTDVDQLSSLLIQLIPQKAREHGPVAPSSQSQPSLSSDEVTVESVEAGEPENPLTVAETLAAGEACRSRLLAICKETANAAFSAKQFDEAERLYGVVLAGTHAEPDASILLNRAAALLKLGRFDDTISAAGDALGLLESRKDAKSRSLAWKGFIRIGKARASLAQQVGSAENAKNKTELIASAREDFERARDIDPTDPTAQSELDALAKVEAASTSANGDQLDPSPQKEREKTILDSPFFRSDLVTGLLADTLRSSAFPLSTLLSLLSHTSAPAGKDGDDEEGISASHATLLSSLTAAQRAQLEEAVRHVGAVLALPHYQALPRGQSLDGAEKEDEGTWRLFTSSLRLLTGCSSLLLNKAVKAQSDLELVADALRSAGEGRKKGVSNPIPASTTESSAERREVEALLAAVRGDALAVLVRCCALQAKRQEADKFRRWLEKWRKEREDEGTRTEQGEWFLWLVKRCSELGQRRR